MIQIYILPCCKHGGTLRLYTRDNRLRKFSQMKNNFPHHGFAEILSFHSCEALVRKLPIDSVPFILRTIA